MNWELVSTEGTAQSAALITANLSAQGDHSHLTVTVQLSSLAQDMEQGYRQGFDAGIGNLSAVASRTMILQRTIRAPRSAVWGAWVNPETLPQWWGPDGFTCRTARIDLRSGGEWVFDMIGPDGTVYPNHHRYHTIAPQDRLAYSLLWGENGPKHADAWAAFDDTPKAPASPSAWSSALRPSSRRPRASAPWNWGFRRWASWRGSSAPTNLLTVPAFPKLSAVLDPSSSLHGDQPCKATKQTQGRGRKRNGHRLRHT